ncbi:PREDICTED: patatin-like phospholipase domain-containing protein 2 [Lupinus angustifolius]|uniref:patatin-like phospholipase domain-containing protein 2 n=1 Tax=Lupinus angustifolius TaxID=3871 RepID=UPI00092F8F7F|nr:PREDICTED: patatin-like phospholipase domain-containing protein 2 [Lupinus angustifolius]
MMSISTPTVTFLSSSSSSQLHLFPIPNPNPNCTFLRRTQFLTFASNSQRSTTPPPLPEPTDKKSFAVATGELFLGLATRLIHRRNNTREGYSDSNSNSVLLENASNVEELKNGIFDERIGNLVVEDEIQPDIIWEQREKDVEAERNLRVITSPGFSFSAAGLLFPYHLGAAHFLIQNGYIKETTPLAGSSAGAIVCAVIASGASMEEALKATKVLAEDCRNQGTAFRLGAVLRDVLVNFLPEDAHIRSNGRVRVGVTQLLWRPRGLLVDQFDSKEDLINAVFTSSFIPGYLAPRPATMFRNRLCVDGGLTLFMPPTSAAKTVRVCAFPASRLGLKGVGISPDCNPENVCSTRQLFEWALEPADDAILDRLFEFGYLDAAVWAKDNPVEEIAQDVSPVVENSIAV